MIFVELENSSQNGFCCFYQSYFSRKCRLLRMATKVRTREVENSTLKIYSEGLILFRWWLVSDRTATTRQPIWGRNSSRERETATRRGRARKEAARLQREGRHVPKRGPQPPQFGRTQQRRSLRHSIPPALRIFFFFTFSFFLFFFVKPFR